MRLDEGLAGNRNPVCLGPLFEGHMRVLVAGATGAIGRPLISALVASRMEVIGITSAERGVQTLRDKGAKTFEEARLQFVGLRKFEARRENRKCK